MTNAVIEANGLTKRYRKHLAVDHIDLAIGEGEVFGLLGPNGAGKTTTILMAMGLTDVSEGTVRVLGLDPARQPLAVKRHIGYMPDSVGFYESLTARENLGYTGRLAGLDRDAEVGGFGGAIAIRPQRHHVVAGDRLGGGRQHRLHLLVLVRRKLVDRFGLESHLPVVGLAR